MISAQPLLLSDGTPRVTVKDFILQGFSAETHREAVRWVLACPNLGRAIFSIAFVNQSGVVLLRSELKNIGKHTTVFAGIRNGITSRQGLETLLSLGTITYIVDTGTRTRTFHPKVFFAQGTKEARLVIGSANLTLGGLNNNIEASVKIGFDLTDSADQAFAAMIVSQFDALPQNHPKNVIRVTTAAELSALEKSGRLLDESLAIAPHPATTGETPADDSVPKITLLVGQIYSDVKKAKTAPAVPALVRAGVAAPVSVAWEQVWQSKPLTERDLTIPKGKTTHATGSINLDKGLLPSFVDHRHYFRDTVFSGLAWQPDGTTVDAALATFQLVVKGIEYGEATLRIAHTTSTTSKAYKQRNAMTRLSWGPLRPFIAQTSLLGRALTLYRDTQDSTKFLIEID